ncbi:hypothetical protein EDD22DRAFT_852445 [Suillus occidentalis]|nr:hypothetical protein EDD22DRAFT_852445 [Suillus occidentalis]
MPHVSLIGSLRRMFMRPGFAKSIRDSRHDQPRRNDDEDFVMTDMHDGTLWHELEMNTIREIGELGWVSSIIGLHSTGPIYYAINDLPQDQRYLQVNVICAAIMPGPKEPNVQQINHCLEPSSCVKMDVHGEDEPAKHLCRQQDSRLRYAWHRTSVMELQGHSHDFHPCAFCDVDIVKVNTPEGYDNSWTPKDDYQMLRQSFYSKDATQARQDAILKDFGVRWSILNLISGWLPSKKSVLDFMHAIFLGIISHLFMCILFGGYMLSGIRGTNSPKRRFEEIINALGENQSLKKADEWCRLLTVTPVVLWWSWRDENDEIPDKEPPLPPNTVFTFFPPALSPWRRLRVGQSFISHYCLESLQLRVPLTINPPCINAYSRNDPKGWPSTHLIYEYLLALPPDTCPFEREQINRIIKVQAQTQGSMMSQIAVYQSEAAEVIWSTRLWPQLRLVNDLSHDDGTPFLASKVARMLTYIHKDGIHYGCTMNRRTQSDSLGFISRNSTRVPVQIIALFVVGILDVVPHVCAVTCLGHDMEVPSEFTSH